MHLTFRNAEEALLKLTEVFTGAWNPSGSRVVARSSRYGDVLMIEEPVTITYTHPRERVLLNPERDCNPFFHLYEALWMLAGRNDVAPLAYYNSRMPEFSDDGQTFNGAYGYRWRNAPEMAWDQLTIIINHLKALPDSRRVVLQMWNVEDDLLKIGGNVPYSKDVCCNTNAYFSLRPIGHDLNQPIGALVTKYALDMTVCNRSNDMVWGMLGANVVHFSILQEYVAAHLGAEVGRYHQFTNNLHVYKERWNPDKLIDVAVDSDFLPDNRPLVVNPQEFDRELPRFVEHYKDATLLDGHDVWQEPFLREVAKPMFNALAMHRGKDDEACDVWLNRIDAPDWKRAAIEWVMRRRRNRARGASPTVDG